jgi:hypothetical protein
VFGRYVYKLRIVLHPNFIDFKFDWDISSELPDNLHNIGTAIKNGEIAYIENKSLLIS